MYITKAIIFNEKDLPAIEREVESNKCPKCNKHCYHKYCGECGSKIELITSIEKEKLDTYDFLEKFDLEIFNIQSNRDDKVCLSVGSTEYDEFISLTEIKNFIYKDNFENREDVKKLIDLFKEHNVPYIIDIVVTSE